MGEVKKTKPSLGVVIFCIAGNLLFFLLVVVALIVSLQDIISLQLIIADAITIGVVFSFLCLIVYSTIRLNINAFLYQNAVLTDIEIRELAEFTLIVPLHDIKKLRITYTSDNEKCTVEYGDVKKGMARISLLDHNTAHITDIYGKTKK